MNEDAAVQDIYRKIEREKALLEGYNRVRQATSNAVVNSKIESQIREAQRNIDYFQQTLNNLQQRRATESMRNLSLQQGGNGGPAPPLHGMPDNGMSGLGHNNQQGYGGGTGSDYGNPGPGGYSGGGAPGMMPPRPPFASGPNDRSPAARPNYGKLGMHM